MPNQQSTTDKNVNPNMMPDKKQVRPEKVEQVEKEGQQFETQNKNPETFPSGPKVDEPVSPSKPDRMEVSDDPQEANEGQDEPNPYHELQGEDKAEGDRENLH